MVTTRKRWGHGFLLLPAVLLCCILALTGAAGPVQALTLGGVVAVDGNGSGVLDAGDQPLAGIPVTIQAASGLSLSTATDSGGFYQFLDLPAGGYIVTVAGIAGYQNLTPGTVGVELTADRSDVNFLLSTATVASIGISGRVLDDANLNGQVDAADRPIALVEVRLLDAGGTVVTSTITDAEGRYAFTSVAAGGNYLITTVPPFATVPQKVVPGPGATAAGVNAIFIRNFVPGTVYPENNFLHRQFQVVSPTTPETPNTVSGIVINDLNGSGARDEGEPGLGGAVLTLLNAAGVVLGSSTSAPTGEFTFTGIPNGDLFLIEADPAGFGSTNAVPGTGGARLDVNSLRITTTTGVTVYGGHTFLDRATGAGPGTGPGPQPGPNAIEGFVFNDAGGDGQVGTGDSPLAGVVVTLRDAAGAPLATTVTGANGQFEFRGLASGVYLVTETDPAGFVSVDVIPGSAGVKVDENTVRISMVEGVTTYAGTVFLDRQVTTPPAGSNSIAGSVFNDANGNGVVDAGEGPLANVAVTLRDPANNPLAVTVTSAAGDFQFNGLAGGTYSVVESDPTGFTSVTAVAGTGGQVVDANTIRVTTTEGIVTYAGHLFLDRAAVPPASGPNTISGTVLNDANGNRIVDEGEQPLAGAVISLQNATGQPVGVTTSGADGSFTFANLPDGTYTLMELDPGGYSSTAAVAGVGGQVLDPNSIRITTVPGLTAYPGHLFLDQSGGTTPAPAPSILSITPATGGPGSTVTISGRAFGAGPVQVLFGSIPATVLSFSSLLNSLVALVPDLPAGPTTITVGNSAGSSNAAAYTVTAPGSGAALAPLFLTVFNELAVQKVTAQVGPTIEVVIAQSLGFAQNQAVSGSPSGAVSTLQSLLARIERSGASVVSPAAKAALSFRINTLIGQLQGQA